MRWREAVNDPHARRLFITNMDGEIVSQREDVGGPTFVVTKERIDGTRKLNKAKQ